MPIKIFTPKTMKMNEATYRLIKIEGFKRDKQIYEIFDEILDIGLPQYMKKNKKKNKSNKIDPDKD